MNKSQLTSLISAFRAINTQNAITPESLGQLLQNIVDSMPSDAGNTPTGSNYCEYCFATLSQLVSSPTVEENLIIDTRSYVSQGTLVSFNTKGDNGPLLTAIKACFVEVTGYVTLKCNDSYTADRILRWFRLDEDGERYAGAVITTHFTGTTQIFSVPISYSVRMSAGDTLSLVHYSSSGSSTISANSSLYFRVTE